MNDEDLDNQIRAALDVEPPAEQLARLNCFWRETSRAESRRQLIWRGAALAAAILVIAAVTVWQLRSGPKRPAPIADGAASTAPIAHEPVETRRRENVVPIDLQNDLQDKVESFAGRSPTTYERVMFTIRRQRPSTAKSLAAIAAVDTLIEELVRNSDADIPQLIVSTDLPADDVERLLLRRLGRSTDVKKLAVLRLLAECGSARSTTALLRLGRREEFRDAVVTTIEHIVGVERLHAVVEETSHTGLQLALIRRLLAADSEAALRGYLSLVEKNDTRTEALAAADELSTPPVDALVSRLGDEDEAVRLSAAVVLGHLNGPRIARLLVERVTQHPESGVEAWIAILACRGPVAEEFLAYATRQPQLLSHVNSARVRWARIIN